LADRFTIADQQSKIAGSAPVSRQTRSAIFVTAIAVSGVFSDGFQIVASPHTAGERRVPRPNCDRKVERGNHCDHTERVPLFHKRWLGRSD
jgi:hypothetical protein